MKIEDLNKYDDLEILVGVSWCPAYVMEYRCNTTTHVMTGWARFRLRADSVRTFTLQESEIPGSVRRSLGGDRLLTVEEIDGLQIATSVASHVAIDHAEYQALCRTARAVGKPEDEVLAEAVAKLHEAIGGWYPNAVPDFERCITAIGNLKNHSNKLANLLNGPEGARKEIESLAFQLKQAEKAKPDVHSIIQRIAVALGMKMGIDWPAAIEVEQAAAARTRDASRAEQAEARLSGVLTQKSYVEAELERTRRALKKAVQDRDLAQKQLSDAREALSR